MKWTINLAITIDSDELDSADKDTESQRWEVNEIAVQWADGLEAACIPRARVRVLRSTNEKENLIFGETPS